VVLPFFTPRTLFLNSIWADAIARITFVLFLCRDFWALPTAFAPTDSASLKGLKRWLGIKVEPNEDFMPQFVLSTLGKSITLIVWQLLALNLVFSALSLPLILLTLLHSVIYASVGLSRYPFFKQAIATLYFGDQV
jgi:hypothetical protein